MSLNFTKIAEEHQLAIDSVIEQQDKIEQATGQIIHALKNNKKVLWCGNGGSAAEAQHMAAELMVRYVKNRQPLASLALTNDTSILTAHPNDYEFETVFSRQVQGLGQIGDILIGMTTSGKSQNVLQAFRAAKEKGIFTIALVGQNSKQIEADSDLVITVKSNKTARIQEGHTFINHLICELLDLAFD